MAEPGPSRVARCRILGLVLLGYSLCALRPFLQGGFPLFFDAHSHLTRSWFAARALAAGAYPSWTFDWYGGYRLFEFYSPGYYLLSAGLGILGGDIVVATKLLVYTGQLLSVVAFYGFLVRLGAAPLSALFGALLYLHDAERWMVLGVIGNHPTLLLYIVAPFLLLAVQRADGTPRSSLRLFASSALLVSAMAFGHLSNSLQILPGLLAFALVWLWQRLGRPDGVRSLAALAAGLLASGAATAFLTLPLLRNLHLVALSLDTGGIGWDFEPVAIALGLSARPMRHIFVTTPGLFWCALAACAGLLSLHPRLARWRACSAGLIASLLSLALLGERAAIALIFFVSPLCVAALEIARQVAQDRGGRAAGVAVQILAVATVPLWHFTRDLTPLRYVDPQTLAVYQRIPETGGLGRTFDVTPSTDSVDGTYGRSSFSPYWTGRAVPFGAFPQGAPLAINLQMALIGQLLMELAAPQPKLTADALDLLDLLHVEWLVDRQDPPGLARLELDPQAAELREPGLLRLRHSSPALFASRVQRLAGTDDSGSRKGVPSLLARLEAQWARDPLEVRGQRSLDALNRTGTRRDWPVLLPLLRAMRIEGAQARADRFFVEEMPRGFEPADPARPAADPFVFSVLAHQEQLRSVQVVARASAAGFVRLAYSFDPELGLAIDGEPTPGVADFLGAVVLPFPAGTHTLTLEAPRATLRLQLLWFGGGIAAALGLLRIACRRPGIPTRRGPRSRPGSRSRSAGTSDAGGDGRWNDGGQILEANPDLEAEDVRQ